MKPLQRIRTHLPGLDEVLNGGLMESGVYFIQGGPGAGKTTLANQLCFLHAQQGGRALYMTLLAESHARMLQHLSRQSFFDAGAIGSRIAYVSGYRELDGGQLKNVIALLRAELTRHRASLLVLDGLVLPQAAGPEDDAQLKEFVHELQSLASLLGCNVLLLTSGRGRSVAAEQTMVDGIFTLEDRAFGLRNERLFEVSKFRGAAPLRGKHSFCITDDGVRIFPRLESIWDDGVPIEATSGTMTSGLPSFDALFRAGAPQAGTATLVQGASGSGKTLLGLQFLQPCSADDRGYLLAFHEDAALLRTMAGGIGLDLAGRMAAGHVEVAWCAADRHALDQLGHQLLGAVDRLKARRVVIDSLGGFAATAVFAERGYRFIAALLGELRRRGASTLLLSDADALTAQGVGDLAKGLPALADHVVQLSVEGELRSLQIGKARGQAFDPSRRALRIGGDGLSIAGASS
jgi:circadian clock protein KaiC